MCQNGSFQASTLCTTRQLHFGKLSLAWVLPVQVAGRKFSLHRAGRWPCLHGDHPEALLAGAWQGVGEGDRQCHAASAMHLSFTPTAPLTSSCCAEGWQGWPIARGRASAPTPRILRHVTGHIVLLHLHLLGGRNDQASTPQNAASLSHSLCCTCRSLRASDREGAPGPQRCKPEASCDAAA